MKFVTTWISIQVSLLGVAAGVRDVRVEGRARLVLCPTIPHLPFVGGLQLFFLDRPRIQFSFQVISISLIASRYLKGGGQAGGQVARHPGEGGGGPAGGAQQGGGLAKQAHPATLLCRRCTAGEGNATGLKVLSQVWQSQPGGFLCARLRSVSGLPKKSDDSCVIVHQKEVN